MRQRSCSSPGKIKYILISGDNRRHNSQSDIGHDSLLNRGIPKESLVLDFAGFANAWILWYVRKRFSGQDSVTVISQQFHNERAIYLARHCRIHAIGYNAKDVSAYEGLKTRMRGY